MLADLKLAMDALEAKAGAVTSANDTETGMWLRIRRAAETIASISGSALDNILIGDGSQDFSGFAALQGLAIINFKVI